GGWGQGEGEALAAREGPRQRACSGLVRPVSAADEERPLVEPQRVATLGERGRLEPRRDRHAGALQIAAQRLRLAAAELLARAEQDRARVGDERGIVCVDRVERAGQRLLRVDELG